MRLEKLEADMYISDGYGEDYSDLKAWKEINYLYSVTESNLDDELKEEDEEFELE